MPSKRDTDNEDRGKILARWWWVLWRKRMMGIQETYREWGKHCGIRRPWAEAAKNEPVVFEQQPGPGWLELSGWGEGSGRGWGREAVGAGREETCRTLSESEFDSGRAEESLRDWSWKPCDRTEVLRGFLSLQSGEWLLGNKSRDRGPWAGCCSGPMSHGGVCTCVVPWVDLSFLDHKWFSLLRFLWRLHHKSFNL